MAAAMNMHLPDDYSRAENLICELRLREFRVGAEDVARRKDGRINGRTDG